MPHKNRRTTPRIMPLNKISERVGVPIKQVAVHLPEEEIEPDLTGGNSIRTKKGVWDNISPGKLRASYTPRGGGA